MTHEHSLRGLLHRATHRVPGVPAHAERPPGHQGRRHHGHAWRASNAVRRHRPPRVLVAWQRRIAAFFGQELR